jgi:hypothetical protein
VTHLYLLFVFALTAHALHAEEIIAWDMDKTVTRADKGFPWDYSPPNNYDWVSPVDYSGGTMYYRYIFRKCAGSGQDICVQFCFHQNGVRNESCGSGTTIKTFESGPVIIKKFSQPLSHWWNKPGAPVDWSAPRSRAMLAIKKGTTTGGTPISNICCNWNWAGLNPDDIYPIAMRFTGVVVSQNGTFSGWENYPDPDDQAPSARTALVPAHPAQQQAAGTTLKYLYPPCHASNRHEIYDFSGRIRSHILRKYTGSCTCVIYREGQ